MSIVRIVTGGKDHMIHSNCEELERFESEYRGWLQTAEATRNSFTFLTETKRTIVSFAHVEVVEFQVSANSAKFG